MVVIQLFLTVFQRSFTSFFVQVQLIDLVTDCAIRQLYAEHLPFLGDELIYGLVGVFFAEGDAIACVADGLGDEVFLAGIETVRTLLLRLSNIGVLDALERRRRRSRILLPDLFPPLQELLLFFTFTVLLTRDEHFVFVGLVEGPGKFIFSFPAHIIGALPREGYALLRDKSIAIASRRLPGAEGWSGQVGPGIRGVSHLGREGSVGQSFRSIQTLHII
jgi:hypothetical protein